MKLLHAATLAITVLLAHHPAAVGAQTPRPATISADDVNLRDAPSLRGATIANLSRGRQVRVEGSRGEWLHVRLGSGAHGWVRRDFVSTGAAARPAPAPPAGAPLPAASAPAVAPTLAHAGMPAPSTSAPSPAPRAEVPPAALAGTRPDPLAGTQPSSAGTIASGARFLLYLLPVLALVVLALRGLKLVQQRLGFGAGAEGRHLRFGSAREACPSPIRLAGAARLGATTLHVVEVRGRVLLLGNGPSGVQTLADLGAVRDHLNEEFQALLNEAASAQDGLPPSRGEPSVRGVVSSLDSALRQARQTLGQSADRVRQCSAQAQSRTRFGGSER